MKHQRVYVQEEIEAAATNVWQLIRDFGEIDAWALADVVKVEGSGVGMIRHIEFNSQKLVERCEAYDDTQMSFSYRLLESPWSISDYVATVVLTSSGPDKTLIEWSSLYQAIPEEVESTLKFIESTYRNAFIACLRKTATKL